MGTGSNNHDLLGEAGGTKLGASVEESRSRECILDFALTFA